MASGNLKALEHLTLPSADFALALPGWYPTWLDPLPGDFNQRHIKAASLYKPQVVLYIAKDASGALSKTEVRTKQLSETIVEIIIIYPKSKLQLWDSFQSNFRFVLYLFQYARLIQTKFGKPAILHSYIVIRGGLAGWLLSMYWKIPFILTENWTIYYPADPGYLAKRNFVFKWLVKKIFRQTKKFLPVTDNLKNQSAGLVGIVPSTVIPNVVETDIFEFEDTIHGSVFKFIHISTMEFQKNPEALLRCFQKFNKQFPDTFLQMVGPHPAEVIKYAASLGLNHESVEFTGAVSYADVATLLKNSHVLVLFSRYENLPCVILEAFCCGVPVISSRVGGIDEAVNEKNGILVESENEFQLLHAFEEMYKSYNTNFNRKEISQSAIQNYSYSAVGKKINIEYADCILSDT